MSKTKPNVAALIIDPQNDFSEKRFGQCGSLFVEGAIEDFQRGSAFLDENRHLLQDLYISFDMHNKMQIFHKLWWKNADGKHPGNFDFQVITSHDILEGKWIPQIEPEWSLKYVQHLEAQDGFAHVIWPDHCLMGHWGQAIQQDILNSVEAWQVEYGSMRAINTLTKGWNPGYEFFGIFQPQIYLKDDPYTHFNQAFAESLNKHAMIYAFGEAESHCFGLSIKQLLDQADNNNKVCQELLGKIIVLSDCMSDIPGYKEIMKPVFSEASSKYGMRIKKTEEVDVLNDLNALV